MSSYHDRASLEASHKLIAQRVEWCGWGAIAAELDGHGSAVIDALLGLPARDWSAEYLASAQRAQERSAASAEETERGRIPDTQPSLAVADYAGTYTSDLYGDVRLTVQNGRLVLDYAPDYVADLEHWHHDTFRARWADRAWRAARHR